MSKKSDISDIIRHITLLKNWHARPPLISLLALLEDESTFITIEAIDLNSILHSAPEISKQQAERIKKYKRSLRKRAAKIAFSARLKIQTTRMDLELDVLNFERKRLRVEKKGLENELRMYKDLLKKSHQ